MASVSLRDVRKRYGKTDVIHGVSIDIADGEFVVIVGPSGCGKSTLLRMVAGLEAITAGEIAIGERIVNSLEPRERDIAMVFQNYALYPHMSVFDNMAYGLRIAGLGKDAIRERVAKAADMLQLDPYLQRKPRALSGGQRQRVAMGRALVRDPAVFLFDEPLSNLDAKLRVQMRLEIRQMQQRVGTTSLYVTHDQVEAMTLADRLVVMNAGVAEQIDSPIAVYREPASVFVASFIGSPAMNIVPADIDHGAGSARIAHAPIAGLPLPDAAQAQFGIRAEHLANCAAPDADLLMHVSAVEALGADTLVHGHATPDAPPGQPALVARVPGEQRVAPGDTLPLRIDRNAIHWFDHASGKRLAVRAQA